jgi:hypothetical protein
MPFLVISSRSMNCLEVKCGVVIYCDEGWSDRRDLRVS